MEYYSFPALLRSSYNNTHEYGTAVISQEDNAVDFTSEFIPLLPLGAEAQIEWVLGERTLYTFKGRVYLSSQNLLRLVEVDASILAPSRTILAVNTKIEATVAVVDRAARHTPEKAPRYAVEILYLTNSLLKLHSTDYIPAKQKLLLTSKADFLPLTDIPLLVSNRVLLRRNDALLLCEILSSNNENFIALSAYAARLAAAEERANDKKKRESSI